jgi:hypothetical protein
MSEKMILAMQKNQSTGGSMAGDMQNLQKLIAVSFQALKSSMM